MKLVQHFIPEDAKCNTHHGLDNGMASTVTIHWIGPFPGQTPEQVRNYWISSKGEASAHFIIKDEECLQCWPLEKAAWHAGCRPGNYTSIGIEVVPEDTDGRFSDKSITTLKELLDRYFPNRPLVRHYDWTGKDCPKFYVDREHWTGLLEKLGRGQITLPLR